MNLFDPTKSFIENLNYLSGPIIAILGLAAIVQIRLAKKAIVITSKRQAAELAAKQIEIYSGQIIPMQNEITDIDEKSNYTRIKCPENLKDFTLSELQNKISEEIISENVPYMVANLTIINAVLNAMNTFSTYFVKGVADEEIAYSAIGSTYCYSVERYCIEICLSRSEEDTEIYHNLIILYNIWNPRLKSNKLSKELARKKEQINSLKTSKIYPLGTK